MCIRDRMTSGPWSDSSRGRGRAVEEARATTGRGPVSYTHLRAHETPEHLECRLLLEIKNGAPMSSSNLVRPDCLHGDQSLRRDSIQNRSRSFLALFVSTEWKGYLTRKELVVRPDKVV